MEPAVCISIPHSFWQVLFKKGENINSEKVAILVIGFVKHEKKLPAMLYNLSLYCQNNEIYTYKQLETP